MSSCLSSSDAGLLKATFSNQPRGPSLPGRHQSEPMQSPMDLDSPDTDDDPLSWSFNSYGMYMMTLFQRTRDVMITSLLRQNDVTRFDVMST